ncbi:MAG: restriction endonuclease [Phormidium sp.]
MQQEKGDALERAVKLIEEAIWKYSSLEPAMLLIENKKIVFVKDVKHEIDLYVEVTIAHGYKSTFIFECKNWKKKVGKNEIIVFSEKIHALSAQKGFFVGREFSKSAVARAQLDDRIELLHTLDFPLDIYPFERMSVIGRGGFNIEAQFFQRAALGMPNPPLTEVDITKTDTRFNGTEIDLPKFLSEKSEQLFNTSMKQINTANLDEGAYPVRLQKTITFSENQLIINGDDIAELQLDISVTALICKPRIIYHFDIEGRGKYIELEHYNYGTRHGELVIGLAVVSNENKSEEEK